MRTSAHMKHLECFEVIGIDNALGVWGINIQIGKGIAILEFQSCASVGGAKWFRNTRRRDESFMVGFIIIVLALVSSTRMA